MLSCFWILISKVVLKTTFLKQEEDIRSGVALTLRRCWRQTDVLQMGCGASAARFISPVGLALQNDDDDGVISLLESSRTINKPIGPQPGDETPLVIATKARKHKLTERMLDLFGDVITQEHLNEALSAAVTAVTAPVNLETVVLLLHHGAHLVSPLKLSRSLKAVGLQDSKQMELLLRSLSTSSRHSSVHGALLNSLCNSSIQVRAKLTEDLLLNTYTESLLRNLFSDGVAPESYWNTAFTDLCLKDDEVRSFKPTCVTRVFIQASHRPETLQRILQSSSVFTKPCDDVVVYLDLLVQAGFFMCSSQRLLPHQLRKLSMLNPGHPQFDSFPEYFDVIYRNPRTLMTLCVQAVRRSLGALSVFHGVKLLEREVVLPRAIKHWLLLENS